MSKYVKQYAEKNGLTRENAKHNLIVSVTKTDVRLGESKNPEGCAIARAILATKPESKRVFIFRSTAFVETARRLIRYNLPPSVQKEVVAFDRFHTMEPGVYQLSAPSPSESKQAQAARDRKRTVLKKAGKPTGGKARHKTANVRIGTKPETT